MPEVGHADTDVPARRNFDTLHGSQVSWAILFRYWRLLIRPGALPPDDRPVGRFRATVLLCLLLRTLSEAREASRPTPPAPYRSASSVSTDPSTRPTAERGRTLFSMRRGLGLRTDSRPHTLTELGHRLKAVPAPEPLLTMKAKVKLPLHTPTAVCTVTLGCYLHRAFSSRALGRGYRCTYSRPRQPLLYLAGDRVCL